MCMLIVFNRGAFCELANTDSCLPQLIDTEHHIIPILFLKKMNHRELESAVQKSHGW